MNPLIDCSGSGMNLLDIRTRNWSEICLQATAPHLDQLLGAPLPSTSVLVSRGASRIFSWGGHTGATKSIQVSQQKQNLQFYYKYDKIGYLRNMSKKRNREELYV